MNNFTGLSAGQPTKGGGITPGKVVVWGATAGLAYDAAAWLDYQRVRYQNWKGQRAAEPADDMSAEEFTDAAETMFLAWNLLRDMRNWVANHAGPVEEWEGDLTTNIKVCQYIEEMFPDEFKAWKTRNYSK